MSTTILYLAFVRPSPPARCCSLPCQQDFRGGIWDDSAEWTVLFPIVDEMGQRLDNLEGAIKAGIDTGAEPMEPSELLKPIDSAAGSSPEPPPGKK